jgi:hypothetical protein
MGALLIGCAGCSGPECTNQVRNGLPSPDGHFIAFVYYRRCSGDPHVSTNVSVMNFRESLRNKPGNVLIAAGEQDVKVSWANPRRLMMMSFKDPTYERADPMDAMTFDYRPAP